MKVCASQKAVCINERSPNGQASKHSVSSLCTHQISRRLEKAYGKTLLEEHCCRPESSNKSTSQCIFVNPCDGSTIFLGVGGTCHIRPTQKELGLNHQQASKLARDLHAHFVQYAHKLVTTMPAIENKNNPQSQALKPGALSTPPNPR
eukprot:1142241-Pelagomonas_calceolata.AAC.3